MSQLVDLIGKTLASVVNDDDRELVFTTTDGRLFKLYHDQDCCESVRIESIVGDLADLIGEPILSAEESTSDSHPPWHTPGGYDDSYTWTFYKFATRKGYVRWLGESNGYYSESVSFDEIKH